MATQILQTGAPPRPVADARFFESYQWCLNPMLSLRDLLQHLGEEIESYRANGDAGWQGEERRINLYPVSYTHLDVYKRQGHHSEWNRNR